MNQLLELESLAVNKPRTGTGHVAAGFFILGLAYLVTLGFPGLVNKVHANIWFFNYDLGYLNRGLMGSLFQFVHGPISMEKFYKYGPVWDKCVLVVVVSLFWAMLIPRIWMSTFSNQGKWLLMALAAIPVLSPIWKEVGSQVGQLDEYVLLWVLLAFFCFLFNRPIGYLCCIAPAFAVHPQTSIYAFFMLMLIVHAVVRNPKYAERWRIWMLVTVLSLLIPALLGLLHSVDRSLALIEMNKDEMLPTIGPELYEYFKGAYGSADRLSGHLSMLLNLHTSHYRTWPYVAMLGIVGYALPIFVYAFVFSYAFGRETRAGRTGFLIFKHPVLARLIPYEHYIVIVGSALMVFPTVFMGDWGRVIYWSWFRVGIASAYFLWFYLDTKAGRDDGQPEDEGIPRQDKGRGVGGHVLTLFAALWAYTFAGAPLVLGNLFDPQIYNCERCGYFIPGLNKNPLGDLYAESVYRMLVAKNAGDVHVDPMSIYSLSVLYRHDNPIELEQDKLRVPADFEGDIWRQYIRLPGNRKISLALGHEGSDAGRIKFRVSDREVEPVSRSAGQTVWQIEDFQELALVGFAFFADRGEEMRITGLQIDFEEVDASE